MKAVKCIENNLEARFTEDSILMNSRLRNDALVYRRFGRQCCHLLHSKDAPWSTETLVSYHTQCGRPRSESSSPWRP